MSRRPNSYSYVVRVDFWQLRLVSLTTATIRVVIESSFVAIERTIQFRLIHDGAMEASEVISSHRRLYQRGAEVGLYDEAFGERLAELWNQNRTKTYYRLGIATEAQAEAMHELATEMHRDLVDGSQVRHECLC